MLSQLKTAEPRKNAANVKSRKRGGGSEGGVGNSMSSRNVRQNHSAFGVRRVSSGRWDAFVHVAGQEITLGSFESESEAARAYDRTAITLFGNNVERLNFPFESSYSGDCFYRYLLRDDVQSLGFKDPRFRDPAENRDEVRQHVMKAFRYAVLWGREKEKASSTHSSEEFSLDLPDTAPDTEYSNAKSSSSANSDMLRSCINCGRSGIHAKGMGRHLKSCTAGRPPPVVISAVDTYPVVKSEPSAYGKVANIVNMANVFS
mmetsp:Transcript_18230/g.29954  ORF Transcript_18230/g.29954 Transcript_18230/m.29954 type:complete len:260 (+) Transcript_18230:108-887(+)